MKAALPGGWNIKKKKKLVRDPTCNLVVGEIATGRQRIVGRAVGGGLKYTIPGFQVIQGAHVNSNITFL